MSAKAKVYLATVYLIGTVVGVYTMAHWQMTEPVRFACYLLIIKLAGEGLAFACQ